MLSKAFTTLFVLLSVASFAHTFPQLDADTTGLGGGLGPFRPIPHPVNQPNTPPPPNFLGERLVNDAAHPYQAPKKSDLRGPCPGLNTLANHGVSSF
jgi:Peroxidase, family 2